jgi:hypothetical protein
MTTIFPSAVVADVHRPALVAIVPSVENENDA